MVKMLLSWLISSYQCDYHWIKGWEKVHKITFQKPLQTDQSIPPACNHFMFFAQCIWKNESLFLPYVNTFSRTCQNQTIQDISCRAEMVFHPVLYAYHTAYLWAHDEYSYIFLERMSKSMYRYFLIQYKPSLLDIARYTQHSKIRMVS